MQSDFVPSSVATLKKSWNVWRETYANTRAIRSTEFQSAAFVLHMRRVHVRALDKDIIREKRVQKEIQIRFIMLHHCKVLVGFFQWWLTNSMAMRVQRSIRVFLAKCKYDLKARIRYALEKVKSKREYMICRNMIIQIKKKISLYRREKIHASSRIAKSIKFYVFKTRIKFNITRKLHASKFASTLAHVSMNYEFHFLKWKLLRESWERNIEKVFNIISTKCLLQGFSSIRDAAEQRRKREYQLPKLEYLLVAQKVEKIFWKDAYKSVHFSKVVHKKSGGGLYSWENFAGTSQKKRDMESFWTTKAFRVWMAVFRARTRKRRNVIRLFSFTFLDICLADAITDRQAKRIRISSILRAFWDNKFAIFTKEKRRRAQEAYVLLICSRKSEVFSSFHDAFSLRILVARRIQNWYRMINIRILTERKRNYRRKRTLKAHLVQTSKLKRIIRTTFWKMKFAYICRSITSIRTNFTDVSELSRKIRVEGREDRIDYYNCGSTLWIPSRLVKQIDGKSFFIRHKEFQSVNFYDLLFNIKKSGVFVFDDHSEKQLSKHEIIYCVKGADVLICPNITDSYLNYFVPYFKGKKIVFWGGSLSVEGTNMLAEHLMKHTSLEGFTISLILYKINIQLSGINRFLECFKLNYFKSLKEIVVDFRSFGVLGLQPFIAIMSANNTLIRLGIEVVDDEKFMEFLSFSLSYLQFNRTLQEIEIFGAPLNDNCVKSIKNACINGLNQLSYLKIECSKEALMEADMLIDVGKRREERGSGISISIVFSDFTLNSRVSKLS